MYILTLKFETTCSGIIQFQYHINEDDIDVFTNIKVNDDYYSLLNPDGTFALNEGSKWEGKYLENDEFGDPIKDKAFIAVYNSDLNYMNSTYIAVMKGDEDHVRFYYDLPWYPGRFDNNKILSIKIKNKIDVYYCGDNDNGKFFKNDIKIIRKLDRNKQKESLKISGTEIRKMIRKNNKDWELFVPKENIDFIKNTTKQIMY